MNPYCNWYSFEDRQDENVVRSLRNLQMIQIDSKQNEQEKIWQDFLSNGSAPIDVIEIEEESTCKWVEKNNNENINPELAKELTYDSNMVSCGLLLLKKPLFNKKRDAKLKNILKHPENRCVFCSNNNEPIEVVRSHSVRDAYGRVLCPKLRTYVCPICKCSGDKAHTVKYCPKKPVLTMEDVIMMEKRKYNNEILQKIERFR